MEGNNNTNWMDLLRSLPASLLFIIIVDLFLMKDLVELYKFQITESDANHIYVLGSILSVVLVNLIIISVFARVRVIQERQRALVGS